MGTTVGLYHFFICGLPGAIDYAFLALKELNYVTGKQRLIAAEILNTWIRSPGLVLSNTFCGLFIYNTCKCSSIYFFHIICITFFLSTFNGIYYAKKVLIAKTKKCDQ